jgi:acyl-CoA dehydrogenase
MPDRSFLSWPFFDDSHRVFARELDAWAGAAAAEWSHASHHSRDDVDRACVSLVRDLGNGGWLRHAVPGTFGESTAQLDVRTLCLARETLARHSGLADFAFAMQGLGSGPISLYGSDALRQRYLPRVARGEAVAAFALSEPEAGSDVTSMTTTATRDSDGWWRLDGEKTWISNGGIADFYTVFAKWPEGGDRAFAAFVVDATNSGLEIAERIDVTAPHPLARLTFNGQRLSPGAGHHRR